MDLLYETQDFLSFSIFKNFESSVGLSWRGLKNNYFIIYFFYFAAQYTSLANQFR